MKELLGKVKQKFNLRKSQPNRVLITSAMVLGLAVVYLVYNHLTANASVTGNKYLTDDGVANNGATISSGVGTYTRTTSSDNSYYTLYEAVSGVGRLAWNFTDWQQMLEAGGDKVTKVTVTMEANMYTSSGNKTFRFSMYNFSNGQYDLDTTSTRQLQNTSDVTFTLEFPTTDYTNYFDQNGYFKIQLYDTIDGYSSRDRINIDLMYAKIYYDNTAPTATWSSPSGTPTTYYTNTNNLNLSASGTDNAAEASGIAHMDYFYDNGTGENMIGWSDTPASGNVNSGSWSFAWASPPEDTYTIYARSVDGKGNISPNTTSQTIVVDRTAPVATFSNPVTSDRIGGSSYAIMGSASDAVKMDYYKLEYYRQGVGPWTQIGSNQTAPVTNGPLANWDTTGVADGLYDLRLTVVDKAGNQNVTTVNNLTVDNTAPIVSLEYYTDPLLTIPFGTVSGKPTVSGPVYIKLVSNETLRNNAGDNQITIDAVGSGNDITNQNFTWNGFAWVCDKWNVSSGGDGDTLGITVKGTDILGNTATTSPVSGAVVTVDTVAPTATITAPTNGATVNGTYAVKGTASDAKGLNYYKVEYYDSKTDTWNQIGTNQSATVTNNTLVSWDTTAIPDGSYNLRLTTYDQAYNSSTSVVTGLITDNFGPILGLEYYQDVTLTTPLETYLGKPITKANTVYVKLTTNKTLRNTAGDNQITIDAPGTVNDLTNANFTWSTNAWVYAWHVQAGSDGNISSITVKGTSTSGFVTTGGPTTGGTVTIDNVTGTPTLDATDGVETVKLTWTVDADVKEIYVYKGSTGAFTPGPSNLIEIVTSPTGQDLTAHNQGYYVIRFKDLAGNLSPFSSVVSSMPKESINKAYIRYSNDGSNVYISVYWNDTGGGSSIAWADDVVASGAALDWKTSGINLSGINTAGASATIPVEKYKNYYIKLTKEDEVNNLRAFPVDVDPDNGPRTTNEYAHGSYSADTPMCAACHSTHVGLKEKLLTQSTNYDLCLLCHGTAATQSKYDVQSGMVKTTGGWKNSLAGPIGTEYGTSKHNVDDRSDVSTTVYGSVPGKTLTFTCLSCHEPHGGMNDNYRLLRDTIYPSDDQSISTTVSYVAYAIVKDPTVGEEVYMVSGNSEFCAACHMDYVQGNAKHSGGIYENFYRHPVTVGEQVYGVYRSDPARNWYPNPADKLPLQANNAGESLGTDKRTAIVCSTCHFAHGTFKDFNMPYPQPYGAPRKVETNQKMLRLDNYGVCESCHKK